MAGHLYEDGKNIGYIEDGFAFDRHGKKRYRVENPKLRDLKTGEVVGYLAAAGMPGTVTITRTSALTRLGMLRR